MQKETKKKDKIRHSKTVYIPRNHHDFWFQAIKERSISLYGYEENQGRDSKYIMNLIKRDLETCGLLDNSGEPNEGALKEYIKDNEKLKTKKSY